MATFFLHLLLNEFIICPESESEDDDDDDLEDFEESKAFPRSRSDWESFR